MDLEIYRSRARYYAAAFDWSVAHQVEHIASLSGLPKGGSVLEPMCGSARLSKAFAAAGFHTLGVDLSAPLIELARIDFSAAGLDGEWLEADVRVFCLDRVCDLAVCPVNSLAHLQTTADMAKHLHTVSSNLRPRGSYWVQLDLKDAEKEDPIERWEFELEGETLEFEWSVIEFASEFETHQDRILRKGEPLFEESHRMRRWSFKQWSRLLSESPFVLLGAYDGNSFTPFPIDDSLETRRVYWQQLLKRA